MSFALDQPIRRTVHLLRPNLSAREAVDAIRPVLLDLQLDWPACDLAIAGSADRTGRIYVHTAWQLTMRREEGAGEYIQARLSGNGRLIIQGIDGPIPPLATFQTHQDWIDSTAVAQLLELEPLPDGMLPDQDPFFQLQPVPPRGLMWVARRVHIEQQSRIRTEQSLAIDASSGAIVMESVSRYRASALLESRRRDRLAGGDWTDNDSVPRMLQ